MSYEIPIIKSKRLTSKNANKCKIELIYNVFEDVYMIKNSMSLYCFRNIRNLYYDRKFKNKYRKWNDKQKYNILPAHTINNLFNDVVDCYKNHIKQLQRNILKRYYRRFAKSNAFKYYKFAASMFYKYPFIIDYETFKEHLADKYSAFDNLSEFVKQHIYKLYQQMTISLMHRLKHIKFSNGSFRLTSGSIGSYEILYDSGNTKYKYFLLLKFNRNQHVKVPLLVEDNYSPNRYRTSKYYEELKNRIKLNNKDKFFDKYSKQILLIDRRDKNTKKLFFAISYEDKLTFRDYGKIIGCDINLTAEKFITTSDGNYISYKDDETMKEFLDLIEEIDKNGWRYITSEQKKKLRKLSRKIQWYIEFEIAQLVNQWINEGITDIVLENLEPTGSTNIKVTIFGKKFKLSRFVRFLYLADLKNIFKRICNNRGIRVHLTPPEYTSRMCPMCGCIDKSNRKTQNEFKCTNCGYKSEADHNASINILLRMLNHAYREKLHKQNKFKEFIPKDKIYPDDTLKVLSKHFKNPLEVLEDLGEVSSSGYSPLIVCRLDYVQMNIIEHNFS